MLNTTHLLKQFTVFAMLYFLCVSSCEFNPPLGNSELISSQCLQSLNIPKYEFCPVMDLDYHYPQFCGVSPDFVWRNYTYVCEAKNDGAFGFIRKACSCQVLNCNEGYECINGNCYKVPTCDNVNCGDGFKCVKGICQPIVLDEQEEKPQCESNLDCGLHEQCVNEKCARLDSCEDVKCPLYEDCDYGVCFRKYDYFCSKIQPQILRNYCPIDRPTHQQCQDVTFVPPLTQTVCGIGYDGVRRDYDRWCTACKHHFTYYYYNQPCSTVPADPVSCWKGEECVNGQCDDIDYCKGVQCSSGKACFSGICLKMRNYCEKDSDCPDGFHCGDLNICTVNIVVDPCDSVTCNSDQRCVQGQCKGLCEDMFCPDGTECRKGLCQTINPVCISNSDCAPNQFCISAHCKVPVFDSCFGITCKVGEACVFGKCKKVAPVAPVDPCANVFCQVDEKCKDGKCEKIYVDPCANCGFDEECVNNACRKKDQGQRVRCSTNVNCDVRSVCVGSYCMKDFPCQANFQCYGSKCLNGLCRNES